MYGNSDDNTGQPQAPQDNGPADASPTPVAPTAPTGLTNEPAGLDAAGVQPASEPPANISAPASAPAPANDDELLDIKQQALQQLTPLVGHLDQTPEEEFRTTMMMIQAADNQELVSKAYEAAQKIQDEKSRAQALLDIVNEINYFTQHNNEAEENK